MIIRWVLCIVLVLATAEIGARMYQHSRNRDIIDSIQHPVYRDYYLLGRNFKPNSGGSWQGIPDIEVNSLGFRGSEFSIEKPEGVYRIVTFGGSTSHSGNYPEKLADLGDWEVINAAVPTWTTTQSLIQFITRAVYLAPDLIIIYHAINDSHMSEHYWFYHLPEVDYLKYGGWLRYKSQLYAFISNRFNVINRWLRQGLSKSQDVEFSTQVYETDIRHFLVLSEYYGIDVLLVSMALNYDVDASAISNRRRAGFHYDKSREQIVEAVGLINVITRGLAIEFGAQFLDASWLGKDASNFVDFCHFSEKGALAFSSLIKRTLDNMVELP